ncbi:unnamed protein product [Umbelopsis sp. WA50703]
MSHILQRVSSSIFKQSYQVAQQVRMVTTESNSTKAKGLQQFFENGVSLPEQTWTGRSWKASELRVKSFEDLHKLWYVLLKERNVLATQREEARRLGIDKSTWTNAGRCKKSMARIKFVLNERQRAYEEAKRLAEQTQANI